MDAKALLATLLAALKPYEAQIAKQLWENVIHPELQKLEAQIGNQTLAMVAQSVDAALNLLIEAEIKKLG